LEMLLQCDAAYEIPWFIGTFRGAGLMVL
jgi:hypothetical protein